MENNTIDIIVMIDRNKIMRFSLRLSKHSSTKKNTDNIQNKYTNTSHIKFIVLSIYFLLLGLNSPQLNGWFAKNVLFDFLQLSSTIFGTLL